MVPPIWFGSWSARQAAELQIAHLERGHVHPYSAVLRMHAAYSSNVDAEPQDDHGRESRRCDRVCMQRNGTDVEVCFRPVY